MGLDMYLTAKRFLWHNEEPIKKAIALALSEAPGEPRMVEVEVCYWRKANQIHQWFVNNIQHGVDDCKPYYVSIENLKQLVETCKEVLADTSLVEEKLPTQGGFFFGCTTYDDGYFEDLKHTIETLESIITHISKYKAWDFEYHSSW